MLEAIYLKNISIDPHLHYITKQTLYLTYIVELWHKILSISSDSYLLLYMIIYLKRGPSFSPHTAYFPERFSFPLSQLHEAVQKVIPYHSMPLPEDIYVSHSILSNDRSGLHSNINHLTSCNRMKMLKKLNYNFIVEYKLFLQL